MPDQEFKLVITGDASGAVAASQAAGDATRKLKVDTSDLSDATKKSLGMLSSAGDEVKNLGKKTEETGEKMEGGGREVRHLANELGRMLGVSDLGAASMGKMGLAVFAVGASLDFLKSTWDQVQEGIKGPIEITVHDDVAKIIAGAQAWGQYAEAIQKAHEASSSPEAAANRENKVLSQKLQLLHDILKAEEDEAMTALALKKDQMSPQAYAAAQQSIRTAFGHKNSDADDEAERARIATMEQQEQNLREDAAKKKAQGEGMSTGNADAQGTAKTNASKAAAELDAINKNLERLDRIAHPDNAQYEGLGGFVQSQKDNHEFYNLYGYGTSQKDARAQEEQRKAQAEAAIALGQRATEQEERLKKTKSGLLSESGTEVGKADELHLQTQEAKEDYNRTQVAKAGTEALAGAGVALTQEGNAEHNNTAQGLRDAQSALAAGISAQRQVIEAVKQVVTSNQELHAGLEKAFGDLRAENVKLAAKIAQMQFNTK
ncbi:hypothetical protein [Silvimonas sp.]|uniref:hypothetical protein n=1 Tax=Silvimonas sp. TaxID=2650811 RepID=UPI00284A755B|nr:hypothetical protein [Silvimonas sp.]MDR3427859.1 hypothetical protein [Silvimonas sp.]